MTTPRLTGLLSQEFVDEIEEAGQFLDGHGLWLVVTERGGRYELRDAGHDIEFVGDASHMALKRARRQALEMREERELDNARLAFSKPLKPSDLHRFVNAWVSTSLAAAAA